MESIDFFQDKQKIIVIPRGPQFKTKGNYFVAMIALGFLVMAITSIYNEEFLSGLVLILISFALFYYILDFHGFQLDKTSHSIRDYKEFLWFKFGKWENLKDFKSIYLVKAHLVMPASEYHEEKFETFHYYHLKLVDEINKKEIFLAEYNNYYKAIKIAENVASETGLELRDFIKGSFRKNQ